MALCLEKLVWKDLPRGDQEGVGSLKPVALLACGSFNPLTVQHLRMMDLAKHFLEQGGYHVLGGYLSPVGDGYNKPGLAAAKHRLEMVKLGTAPTNSWMADSWEALQPGYVRTLHVLRSVREELNHALQEEGWAGPEAEVKLVCGADLLESFNTPGVWKPEMLRELLGAFGVVCVVRQGTDLEAVLNQEGTILSEHTSRVQQVEEPFTNVISSSLVREQLQEGRPLNYIVPDPVLRYIRQHGLYGTADSPSGTSSSSRTCPA